MRCFAQAGTASGTAHLKTVLRLSGPGRRQCFDGILAAWFENELLDAPVQEFRHEEDIFRWACDLVDPSELFELLARFPENAEDFTVETELVDSSRITIGAKQDLVRRRSDADCPRRSRSLRLVAQDRRIGFVADRRSCLHIEWHIDRNLAQELSLNVEHLNPTVSSVSNVDVIFCVHRNAVRRHKLAWSAAGFSPGLQPVAILVDFCDARVDVAIADVGVAS